MIYHGDCLHVVENNLEPDSIDLIYLDPPFNTGRDFGEFNDDWDFYKEITQAEDKRHDEFPIVIKMAMDGLLWTDDSKRYNTYYYLLYMTIRLMALYECLKDTGSLYLHVDYRTCHYFRIILDRLFGNSNFKNDIIWCYKTGGGSSKNSFSRKHDTILFYTKSDSSTFNVQKEKSYNAGFKPYGFKAMPQYQDSTGWYTMPNMKDYWNITSLGRNSKDRTGYPTQKPIALLDRIVKASSNIGDTVLDPFCGSGTTLKAAQDLERKYIGIDISAEACRIAKDRLSNDLMHDHCPNNTQQL